MEDLFIAGFFLVFVAFIGFFFLVGLILFILQAIGLYNIAKREGKGDIAWLAWIPIISQFLFTLLVEKDVHPGLRGRYTWLFLAATIVALMLGYFVCFVPLIPLAMFFYAFYFIAKRYTENPVLYVVIAIITVGWSIPIQIFMFRNRNLISSQKAMEAEPLDYSK